MDFPCFKDERIRCIMGEEELDVLIATLPENIWYLSGYESIGHRILHRTQIFAMLELKNNVTSLAIPLAEVPTALERFPKQEMTCYGNFHFAYPEGAVGFDDVKRIIQASESDSFKALCKNIEKLDKTSRRIGLDESRLTPALWKDLESTFPDKEFVPAVGIFGKIRMIKHESEVALLERAAEIAEESLYSILPRIVMGTTEYQIGRWYMEEVIKLGAEPYFNVVTIDERSAFADTINTNKSVKDGSIIRFDIGCIYQGYRSDIARTAVFGKCQDKVEQYYRAILQGEERAVEQIKPGVSAEYIFDIAVEETRKAGIPHYKRHHCGHGIGLEVYDPPSVAPGVKTKIEPGMVLCIETPYYELGWGGIQVEDTIVVTDIGSRYLTKSSRELIKVGV